MRKLLKNKLIIGAMLSSCALSSNAGEAVGSVEDSILRGLRGALKAVELPSRVARERAEDLYTYNHGATITQFSMGTNDYLDSFNMCSTYAIKMVFDGTINTANSRPDGTAALATTTKLPVPTELLGKTIYLVPIYAADDYKITDWECVTNFNLDQDLFRGDSGIGVDMDDSTTVASRSSLAKFSDDPAFEKCVYMQATQFSTLETSMNCS